MPEKFAHMKKARDNQPPDDEDEDSGAAKIIHDGDKIIYDYSHVMNQEPKLIKMKKTADLLSEKEQKRAEKEERKREKLAFERSSANVSNEQDEHSKLYKTFVSAVDGFFAFFGLKSPDYEERKAERKLSKQKNKEEKREKFKGPTATEQIMTAQEKTVDERERSM